MNILFVGGRHPSTGTSTSPHHPYGRPTHMCHHPHYELRTRPTDRRADVLPNPRLVAAVSKVLLPPLPPPPATFPTPSTSRLPLIPQNMTYITISKITPTVTMRLECFPSRGRLQRQRSAASPLLSKPLHHALTSNYALGLSLFG